MKKYIALLLLTASFQTFSAKKISKDINWTVLEKKRKSDLSIQEESRLLSRPSIRLQQRVKVLGAPTIELNDVQLDQARKYRYEQNTLQLIQALETQLPKTQQQSKIGEIKMRLAELYYERAEIVALKESDSWSKRLKSWETLSSSQKAIQKKPVLYTPRANKIRQDSLSLYRSLEAQSRGKDFGRSLYISREEVLFYLATTYMQLGKQKAALPYLKELTTRYPKSKHLVTARLNLADYYFEKSQYTQSIPEYLKVAVSRTEQASKLREYALYRLGWAYTNTQKYDKAIRSFQQVIQYSKKGKGRKRAVFSQEAYTDLATVYAKSGKYMDGQKYFYSLRNRKLLENYQLVAAHAARDRGEYKTSEYFYQQLLKNNPTSALSKEIAMERLAIMRRSSDYGQYSGALESLIKKYGASSRWLKAQKWSKAEKSQSVSELVGILRKETKFVHKQAQTKKSAAIYAHSRKMYEVYLKYVPRPNVDTAANVADMKFYYAEVLYELKDYPAAAHAYSLVPRGKHSSVASYNRILSYREAMKKNSGYSKYLLKATNDFVKKFPNDPRGADLLYASASKAFESGASTSSLGTLYDLVKRYPNSKRGVQAAERIVFIHDKNKNYKAAALDIDKFLANQQLMKTGGSSFKNKIGIQRRSLAFKLAEQMPELDRAQMSSKGDAFYNLSPRLGKELKEKALNNAIVYYGKAGVLSKKQRAESDLLKHFPSSGFANNIYLKRADDHLRVGNINNALNAYRSYLSRFKKASQERTQAQFNVFYIQAHLENTILASLSAPKKMSSSQMNLGKEILSSQFATAENKSFVVSRLAIRPGVSASEIASYKSRFQSAEMKKVLHEADVLQRIRQGASPSSLISLRGSPYKTQLSKEALAQVEFKSLESNYNNYRRNRISFQPEQFSTSLDKKIDALEKLEKSYLKLVEIGDAPYALKSLGRVSDVYGELYAELYANEEVRKGLKNMIDPLKNKSLNYQKLCLKKAVELNVTSGSRELCSSRGGGDFPAYLRGPTPQWMSAIPMTGKYEKFTVAAYTKKHIGEFLLGYAMMKKYNQLKHRAFFQNLLAIMDWRVGRTQAALNGFQEAYSLGADPTTQKMIQYNLASFYLNSGNFAKAAAYTQGTTMTEALLGGLQLIGEKQYPAALAKLKTVNSASLNPYRDYHLGLASMASGRKAEAKSYFSQFRSQSKPDQSHPVYILLRGL